MERGLVQGNVSKGKLNTKSSTESELIGASEYIAWTVWAKIFLAEQGYNFNRNIFYQDNQRAMKVENNGQKSCGEKSRHMRTKYFSSRMC